MTTGPRIRPKLTASVPFPVHPPVGGGQQRMFHLYRHLARAFDVELVTLGHSDTEPFEGEIAPGLREIRIPKTARHQAEEDRVSMEVGGVPVGDIGLPLFGARTPEYGRRLARSIAKASVVVASHPYGLPAIQAALGDRPLVYEAHNVEHVLKQAVLGAFGAPGAELVEAVRELEAAACRASDLILCCSTEDRDELCRRYGADPARILQAPNGVDTEAIRFTTPLTRDARKAELGLAGERVALFVGSWHPPNLEAAELVFEIARAMAGVKFVLAGSQCQALADRPRPANVGLIGVVDDNTLAGLLAVADVALNPMRSGSGSNLKVATYLAAGLPVVTTALGARGYDLADGHHALVGPIEDFPGLIARVLEDSVLADALASQGRRLVEQSHDWGAIAAAVTPALRRLVADRDPRDGLLVPVTAALVDLGMDEDEVLARRIAVAVSEIGFR